MDAQKELIVRLLQELLVPQGIYEKSDLPSRKVEGIGLHSGLLAGSIPDLVEIKENNLSFIVDIKNGQKTGFFLDQRNNRAYAGALAAGKKVLNCFCYSGGFSIYAAIKGAEQTANIDISPEALTLAKKNFSINSLAPSQHRFLAADGFTALRDLKQKSEKFDLIILDPPAFAKNQSTVQQAARGYKDINLQAMQLMASEGILVTCSCSQHLDRMLFQKIVHDASVDAGRGLQFISIRGQAEDHPINAAHPEGEYLKCLVARVI
jgi:23S rRNA (cytosine1962-C5)-methyltransferase